MSTSTARLRIYKFGFILVAIITLLGYYFHNEFFLSWSSIYKGGWQNVRDMNCFRSLPYTQAYRSFQLCTEFDVRNRSKDDPRFSRTSEVKSYVFGQFGNRTGELAGFYIRSRTLDGAEKVIGFDWWRVKVVGPASLSPFVKDFENGTYLVTFLPMEPGLYTASIVLEYSSCDAYLDPAPYWTYQLNTKQILENSSFYRDRYINQPLVLVQPLIFNINDSQLISGPDSLCSLIPDYGMGRWIQSQNTWRFQHYLEENAGLQKLTVQSQSGVLFFYGDSISCRHRWYLGTSSYQSMCSQIFGHCSLSYNHIYRAREGTKEMEPYNEERVLDLLREVIYAPEHYQFNMRLILNYGLHYVEKMTLDCYVSLLKRLAVIFKFGETWKGKQYKFPGKVIWVLTSNTRRERFQDAHAAGGRFINNARVEVYNHVAKQILTGSVDSVFDFYWITHSWPGSTTSYGDAVHYEPTVHYPFFQQLFNSFKP